MSSVPAEIVSNHDKSKSEHSKVKGDKIGGPKLESIHEKIIKQVVIGTEKAESLKGKEVTLFIGNTGAGKSTLISYLMGAQMIDAERNGLWVVIPSDEMNPKYPKLGHNLGKSETVYPQGYAAALQEVTLCDYPGFLDSSNESDKRIAMSINRQAAIQQAKNIKVVVVISFSELTTAAGIAALNLVDTLSKVFKDPSKILGSITWIVTRIPKHPVKNGLQYDSKGIAELIEGNFLVNILNKFKKLGLESLVTARPILQKVAPHLSKKHSIAGEMLVKNFLDDDALRIESLYKQQIILETMKSNVLAVNLHDDKDRKLILDKIAQLKAVDKSHFSFHEVEGIQTMFEEIAYEVAMKTNKLFEDYGTLTRNLKKLHQQLTEVKEQIEICVSKGVKEVSLKQISDLRHQIWELRESRSFNLNQIKKKAEELALLDTSRVELYDYFPPFQEERAMAPFGWFGYSKKVFKYEGSLPLVRCDEKYDTKHGYLEDKSVDLKAGKYKATYYTYFGKPANIKIDLFVERRVRYHDKINELKEDIEKLRKDNEALNKTINDLNIQINSKTQALSLQDMMNQLESTKQQCEDEIVAANHRLKNKTAELDHIKFEFAALYPLSETMGLTNKKTKTPVFDELQKAYDSFNTYSKELQQDPERIFSDRSQIRRKENDLVTNQTSALKAHHRIDKQIGWLMPHGQSGVKPSESAKTTGNFSITGRLTSGSKL